MFSYKIIYNTECLGNFAYMIIVCFRFCMLLILNTINA